MNFYGTEQNREPKIPKLRIIKLGGDVGATRNLFVYECGDDILIVDCGFGFPDSEMLGINVVIPDVSYLIERKDHIKGMFITHAHDDHIGAVPYVIEDLGCPIYASKLVLGFIQKLMEDRYPKGKKMPKISFNAITPDSPEVRLGCFRVKAFGVNHSVPSGMGYAITTPQGMILHIADYKIDWTPVLDKPIELGKIAMYGDAGVLCLLSDCLGITTDGYTKSEQTLSETFDHFIGYGEGRQILFTTLSSNISRMYQIAQVAIKHGRKIVFIGRSVIQNSDVARELKYLPFSDDIYVSEKNASKMDQKDLVYIIAGSYGQPGSALERLSRGEHNNLTLQKDALVVFSADPNPPGVQEPVEKLLHNLTVAGAEVIYSEIQDNLHVSGHGLKGDLTTVTALSKAKYYMPIGGTAAKMRAYTNVCISLGVARENVFETLEGESIVFENGKARKGETVEVKPVYIDANGAGEVNPVVIRDRDQLSTDGVFVVVIPASANGDFFPEKAEVVTRGFIYVKGSKELMNNSKQFIVKSFNKGDVKTKEWQEFKRKLESKIEDYLYKETGKRPMVIVHSITV